MQSQNFTTSFTVEQTPTEVYDAINDVRGWWTGVIEGESKHVGDEFSYRYARFHYSKQEIVELVPGTKVVWRVIESRLEGFENASGPRSDSHIVDWYPSSNASRAVRAAGVSLSTEASVVSSPPVKDRPSRRGRDWA
jgi:hypothetical protein